MTNRPDEQVDDVIEKLALLAPGPAEAPRPAALARLRPRLQPASPTNERFPMLRRTFALPLIALLALAAVLTVPPLRAAAGDFLGLFRVQKFAPISISPQQLALLEELGNQGLYPGEVQMIDEPAEPRPLASLAEARARAGFALRGLPGDPVAVHLLDGGRGRLVIDLQRARAFLQAAGADPALLPDSLEGQSVEVTLYPGVSQEFADGTVLTQMPSPEVAYPEGVDPAALGEAALQLMGMGQAEARRLAAGIDWTSTLLLPIPADVATFGEVSVDGASGLALSSLDGQNAAILWQTGGVLYMLAGRDVETLLAAANVLG
ncbi:MAG: hypothetical protein ACRDHL_15225 [Candidatus Promineifilaceae bacterium]